MRIQNINNKQSTPNFSSTFTLKGPMSIADAEKLADKMAGISKTSGFEIASPISKGDELQIACATGANNDVRLGLLDFLAGYFKEHNAGLKLREHTGDPFKH